MRHGQFPLLHKRQLWPVGLFCSPWPEQALRANIHCQISLALNRIYTEWYPSKGYTFNITNSTSYDQYYVHGRTVFEVMVRITDDIFNTYLRKRGTVNPYYSEYCDGKSVTCPGLKQWGTVTLANNGRSALQILRYYYGSSIEIVRTKNIRSIPQSYPGTPLRQGSRGTAVFTLQRQLNRIAKDYPFLGKLTVDGVFGTATANAVRAFQRKYGLTVDGIVGQTTWKELYDEFLSIQSDNGTPNAYPGTPLTVGSSGEIVLYYNLLLLRIAYYFSSVEAPPLADRYTDETATATRSAQQLLGLEQTGIADADTWTAVEALSLQLAAHAPNPDRDTPPGTAYPGRAIAEGSAGQEVGQVECWLNRRAQLSCGEDYVADNNRFGASDAAAVRAVQQQAGLQPVNGIVYRETWHALQAQCTDPCGCEKEE